MTPVLAIPFLTGERDLIRCVESIDTDVRLLLIDNSVEGIAEQWDAHVLEMPNNIGYPASVNLAIKCYPHEPFWLIANHDVVFAPGDLDRLIEEMHKPGPRWVGINDWRVFGLSAECVEAVGFWDENCHPAYMEDADYEYRCRLAGVPMYCIWGDTTHVGSASLQESRYQRGNARSYPSNRAYHRRKWGGELRGGEVFTSPFGQGGDVGDWRLDLRRLRDNAW